MAAYALPEFVVFQSKYNKKYLQFVHQDGDLHGFLQFSGDQVVSPYTKFQVVVSEYDNNLVHLKSCYNNKFWAASEQNDNWILAEAMKSSESTLFEPTFQDAKTVRLSHVKLGKIVTMMNQPGQARDACLYPQDSSDQEMTDLFTVIDWSSIVMLPRNVAFKGGLESKYLCARPVDGAVRYLQFLTDDVSDPTAGHEVFISDDGNISLKSDFYEKFWTRTSNSWILADEESTKDINILFSPVTIQKNVVALKSLGNNYYCKSVSANDAATKEPIIALSAADTTITKMSHLEVVDRAVSKNVTVEASDFRIPDGRTPPNEVLVTMASGQAYNNTNEEMEATIVFKYNKRIYTNTWNSTANGSLKAGDNVGINSPTTDGFGGQPIIVESDQMIGNIVWGNEVVLLTLQPAVEEYKVTLPPMHKVTVRIKGGLILWDVPFSYTQTNTLLDGTVTSFKMDDGIHSGSYVTYAGVYDEDVTPLCS